MIVMSSLLLILLSSSQLPLGLAFSKSQLPLGSAFSKSQLIDLSYSYSESDQSIWPGVTPFKLTTVTEGSDNKFNTFIAYYDISMSEHIGTHMDAPFHFNADGWSTEEIPLDRLMDVPAIVVDISGKAKKDPGATLDASDLDDWVERNGAVPPGSVVLMRSGWGKYYHNNPVKYLGTDSGDVNKMVFPGFGTSGIDWLVNKTSFIGIGVDSVDTEDGIKQQVYVHKVLAGGNRYGLESVANLELLPEKGFKINVLPIKVKGGSGGPCRIVAKLE